jgi:hypothetical protein
MVTYCGNYPDLDHTGCPSSVECTAASPMRMARWEQEHHPKRGLAVWLDCCDQPGPLHADDCPA